MKTSQTFLTRVRRVIGLKPLQPKRVIRDQASGGHEVHGLRRADQSESQLVPENLLADAVDGVVALPLFHEFRDQHCVAESPRRRASAVLTPATWPSSISACLTHILADSTPYPSWDDALWTVWSMKSFTVTDNNNSSYDAFSCAVGQWSNPDCTNGTMLTVISPVSNLRQGGPSRKSSWSATATWRPRPTPVPQ